jgi:hypothetical protein
VNLRTFRYVLAALIVGVLCVAAACAGEPGAVYRPRSRPRPAPPPYSFSIENEEGSTLPSFHHEGRAFILGEPGERYNIRVQNPTSRRVEVVVSVDGRDAISGRVADYGTQRGYVVPPYGSLLVEGFRQSYVDVASFRFTSPGNSYSARRGTPENVGVIGVAFFPERVREPQPMLDRRWSNIQPSAPSATRSERSSDDAPEKSAGRRADGASAAPHERRQASSEWERDTGGSVNNLGTEYGERRSSSVVDVAFERAASRPALLASVRYDDAEGLEARGIDLSNLRPRHQPEPQEPLAFPNARFAAPPN